MITRPMLMFACEPCGGDAPATIPEVFAVQGAELCDDRINTLQQSLNVRLIGSPSGSSCLAFLHPGNFPQGFVLVDADGNARISDNPNVVLDFHNPHEGDPEIIPSETVEFPFIVVSDGGGSWQFLQAPKPGEFTLKVIDGNWVIVDSAVMPGQQEAVAAAFISKGLLLVTVEDPPSSGIYTTRKLEVRNKRVVVGDTAAPSGYRPIADSEPLEHVNIKALATLQSKQFEHLDDNGAPVAQSMLLYPAAGAGALTDGEPVIFSPTAKRFYRMPPRVKRRVPTVSDVTIPSNGTWADMGGHCKITNEQFNFPDCQVLASIKANATGGEIYDQDFAIFIDGVETVTWDIGGDKDNNVNALVKGLTIGPHTLDIRCRKPGGSPGVFKIVDSHMDVFSVL